MAITGDCVGLVTATVAVGDNLDMIREQLICLNELLRQALEPRTNRMLEFNVHQQNLANMVMGIRETLLACAMMISRTDAVDPASFNIDKLDIEDFYPFNDCSSNVYCPPGYAPNPQGVCVPVSQLGGQ